MTGGYAKESRKRSQANASKRDYQSVLPRDPVGRDRGFGQARDIMNQRGTEIAEGNWPIVMGSPSTQAEMITGYPELRASETCMHHWIIKPAEGAISKGICKFCGTEREFQNYWDEDATWDKVRFIFGEHHKWDRTYERDRDEDFVKSLRTTVDCRIGS